MIIALDFDGVTHPKYMPAGSPPFPTLEQQLEHAFQAEKLKIVEDILDALPNTKILISSTWRVEEHLKNPMMEALSDKIKDRLVGASYIIPYSRGMGQPNGHNEAEIQLWLEDNAPDEPWLAVNDRKNMFYPDAPLYLVDGNIGLQEADKDKIISMAQDIEANTQTADIHDRREYVIDQHRKYIYGRGAVISKPDLS